MQDTNETMPLALVNIPAGGRRKKKRTTKKRGKGIFGDIGAKLGGMAGNAIGGFIGFGRRRRRRGKGALTAENRKVLVL